MKKITLLLLLTFSFGFAQTELLTNGDFTNGIEPWAPTGDFSVVNEEAVFASTVAAGDAWTNQLVHGSLSFENGQEYVLTFSARTTEARAITVAIQNVGVWSDQFRSNYNLTTTMTEFSSTFNATSTNTNVQIGFLVAGFSTTAGVTIDDVSLTTTGTVAETCSDGIMNQDETGIDCGGSNCDACPNPPTTAAPTPPNRVAADVISLFSDVYTDITIDTFDTSWCGATTTDVTIAGNAVKKISGLGCEGIEFVNGRFDATGFTHFHMDIYTDSPTTDKSFNIKFSNWQGGTEEANAITYSATNGTTLPSNNPGTWISLDIPFNDFSAGDMTDFVQFVITSDLGNVWYDNLYLHKATTASTASFTAGQFEVYPNPTQNVWNIKTTQEITAIQVYDVLGKQVLANNYDATSVELNASSLKSGLYFAKVNTAQGVQTLKLVKK